MIRIWERYVQMMLRDWRDWSWRCWLRRRRHKRNQTVRPERAQNVDTNWLLNDEKRCKTDWDMRLTFWCRVRWGLWWRSSFSTTNGPIWTIVSALQRYDRVVFSVKRWEADVQWIQRYRSKTKKGVSPSQIYISSKPLDEIGRMWAWNDAIDEANRAAKRPKRLV